MRILPLAPLVPLFRPAARLAMGLTILTGFAAQADDAFVARFQSHLAAADLGGAMGLAQSALATTPDNAQARFALGTTQFLLAVEHLGQGLYDHGLEAEEFKDEFLPSVTNLPFLRLPVGSNPAPKPFTAEVFRHLLTEFDRQIMEAEATLADVPTGPVALPLDVRRISLDFNHDGQATPNEALPFLIKVISGAELRPDFPTVNFDESDVIWLRGYTHLLAGTTDIVLAHDWTETVNQTFQSAFPKAGLPSAPLNADRPALLKALRANLTEDGRCYSDKFKHWDNVMEPGEAEDISRQHRCDIAESALRFSGIGDLLAFVHLFRWPVVDAPRLLTARQHFLTMISLSRDNWASILAETDDNAEWVPGPLQSSLFPRMRVDAEIVAGWTEFLDQAEGVLQGRLLVAHWRFDKTRGVNIRRMFEEPRTLDPVLILSGVGALPYLETGQIAGGSTMDTGMRLMSGGMMAYFLWFN